jgi:Flp pilus assembly protein TadD
LPGDPALARLLARLCYERKEYARAIQVLQESARIRPLDADSFYYLGMSYSQAKQRSQAQESLRKALAAGLHEPLAADAKRVVAESEKNP